MLLACQQVTAAYLILAITTLFQWQPGIASHAEPLLEQPVGSTSSPLVLGGGPRPPPPSSPFGGGKSAADLAAKLLLLDELVSLENDVVAVTETKKKRSFPGFGSPLDRLSAAGSVDLKVNQRKVLDLPKRRFRLPLDRIGMNRLSNSRG